MIYKAEDGMVCSTRDKLCMKKFRQALQREASALRRSCLTTIATNMLASILITAVISNGFLEAASPFVPAKPQHPTAQRQMSLGIPVADRPERILKLLSLFDEAQKSAIPIADPKISGIKAYAKMYGKKVETEGANEGPSNPLPELNKDLLEISPLHGKNFWKPSLPTSWKLKRVSSIRGGFADTTREATFRKTCIDEMLAFGNTALSTSSV